MTLGAINDIAEPPNHLTRYVLSGWGCGLVVEFVVNVVVVVPVVAPSGRGDAEMRN